MPSTGSAINKKAAIESVIGMALLMPGMLLFPLGFSSAMCQFIYGVLLGFLIALLMDFRRALIMVAAFTVANLVAYAASPHALLAALVMAGAVLLYGLTLRIGLASVIAVAPVSVAFTISQPPTVLPHSSEIMNLLVLGAVCVIAVLWGAVAGTLVGRKVPHPPLTGTSWHSTWVYTVALTLECGIVALIVGQTKFHQDGAWVLLTILMVSQPGMHRTWRKVGDRLLGTFIGFAVALVVGVPLNGHPAALTLAAIVLLGIAGYLMLSGHPYWQFVMFLTPGVVLVVGASSNIVTTDINRVWSTFVGAALAVGVRLVLGAIGVHDRESQVQPVGR